MSLTWMGLAELGARLKKGDLSSVELTHHFLGRIAKADATLHAFTEVYADQSLALAQAADQARFSGLPMGPLAGLPIVLKDLLHIQGHVSTLGSKHFVNQQAHQTSATVERLLQAGMIPLGKLHMTEFAFGGWGTNPLMGTPTTPGTWRRTGCLVAPPAAPAWRWPRVWRPWALAATPVGRCASPAPSMA